MKLFCACFFTKFLKNIKSDEAETLSPNLPHQGTRLMLRIYYIQNRKLNVTISLKNKNKHKTEHEIKPQRLQQQSVPFNTNVAI